MSPEMNRFTRFAAANPAVLANCLKEHFNVDVLTESSRAHGFAIERGEVEDYLKDTYREKPCVRISVRNSDGGMRELTSEEVESIHGGLPMQEPIWSYSHVLAVTNVFAVQTSFTLTTAISVAEAFAFAFAVIF